MSPWVLLVAASIVSCSRTPPADETPSEAPPKPAKKPAPSADLPDQEELSALATDAGLPSTPLTSDAGRAVAAKTSGPVKSCFLEELTRTKGASGTVRLRVVLDKTGKVAKVELPENPFSKAFETCVVGGVGKLAFAPAASEQTVEIPYKFNVK